MSTDKRDQIKRILDLADKHAQRARDNEDIAGARAQDARAKHFDAIRHNAHLGALIYAIGEVRKLASEWDKAAEDFTACGDSVSLTAAQTFRCAVKGLDDLAFRLLSEVDES